MRIDVFIDLTAPRIGQRDLDAAAATWPLPEHLGTAGGRVTIVTSGRGTVRPSGLPEEWQFVESGSPITDLNAAMDRAGLAGRGLVALIGLVDLRIEALGVLHRSLERDPMFGFAIPRVSCVDGCCIARLTRNGIGPSEWLRRTILSEIREHDILLETMSPCVLMAPQITGNFGPLEAGFESLPAALLASMARARRCGFRTIACHRAIVALGGVKCNAAAEPVAALAPREADLLERSVPDLTRSWEQSGAGSATTFERLYAALPQSRSRATPPSLLLDVRSVVPGHNGTTHAVLGLATAFQELAGEWSVSLLATEEGAAFHDLPGRFRGWPLHTALPDRSFTVALRLCQPWRLRELLDLHTSSMLNACLLLDTIAWDVAYCAPPHIEGVWQFLAAHADGLLYDSEFTRERFLTRFPAAGGLPGAVTHFSFDPADYSNTAGARPGPQAESYILVVGNHLDHKDVRQTVRTLATAFPYRPIKVLGPSDVISPFVSAHPSGTLAPADIDRLYASAACVVYPSFYEGFGFPMLTGLAYGRTVFVRRSALVHELAPRCHGRGRLVTFDRRDDLVDLLGRMAAGEVLDGVPIADPQAAPPRGWGDVARDTRQFLSSLLEDRTPGRWRVRELAVRQLVSYRGA